MKIIAIYSTQVQVRNNYLLRTIFTIHIITLFTKENCIFLTILTIFYNDYYKINKTYSCKIWVLVGYRANHRLVATTLISNAYYLTQHSFNTFNVYNNTKLPKANVNVFIVNTIIIC